uniref:Wall-associated receptor kinase galacturonan-binding domain-containing protein n=1 Tax=Cajanus cajan TaxID=3821 RepID=A0A151RVU2_CAJCA|nr:hypothetical protein KK1_031694 [Cajanus cajan]
MQTYLSSSSELKVVLLILIFLESSHAVCVSSCGSIHSIRYPFRLNDDPKNCGHPRYNLHCQNNLTLLYLNSIKYYVKPIDYANNTIRVVDSNIQENSYSFVPRYSVGPYNNTWFNYLNYPYQ